MRDAVLAALGNADAVDGCCVADFRPEAVAESKITRAAPDIRPS
jgi:hypothetical protein